MYFLYLFYFILFYFILFYFILFYFILFYLFSFIIIFLKSRLHKVLSGPIDSEKEMGTPDALKSVLNQLTLYLT